jgi:hypothetical protein
MTWIGYDNETGTVNSYTLPYASYSLDQARKSGKRWAMINVAEFNCPGCRNSATELAAMGAAVVQAGGLVIEVLMTYNFTAIASKTNLDYWVDAPGAGNTLWGPLSVTTVKDPDNSSGTPSYNLFGRRDQAYIVDLKTMTITQYIDGAIVAQSTNSAGLAMQALESKLSGDAGGGG